MAEIVFYCPNADLSVHQMLDDNVPRKSDEELYEPILCLACTRLHFINKKTGKPAELTAQGISDHVLAAHLDGR